MITCKGCEETKPDEEFNWRSKPKGIRQGECKQCIKRYYINNRQTYIDRATKNNRRYYSERRLFLDELKNELKCEKCGEDHPATLDFHHDDPAQKDRAVSSMLKSHSIEKIKIEISKCRVWCSNCHRKHHWEERQCPTTPTVE